MMRLDALREEISGALEVIGRPVALMEVCGTHTMSAFRSGLRSLLPPDLKLLSGPGCPVCVTPAGYVEEAVAIAEQPGLTIATFGDMLRVPGTTGSLEKARAKGADVRVVYSPLDALDMAESQPGREVVFLGVGFETTVPAVAGTIQLAARKKIGNFSVFTAHKTMPRAMAALLEDQEVRVDGFLCPGHVSVIIGARAYQPLCESYGMPCVISGFEAEEMLAAIVLAVGQVKAGRAEVENAYTRCVTSEGNREAQALIAEVFEPADAQWRGLGGIPGSGLMIREAYSAFDSRKKLSWPAPASVAEPAGCRCGDVLRGLCLPTACGLFGRTCTPESPVGACMVSTEGTCAAYHKYAEYEEQL